MEQTYISQTFPPRHVLSAVENMINKYSLMKEYFKSSRSSLIVRDGITMHKEDELLLDKIIKFIEDNIDDESMKSGFSRRLYRSKQSGIVP